MFAISLCRGPDTADSSDKRYFQSVRIMHSSHSLREGAEPEVLRDNMGHANIDVTQNVYGKSLWEEQVDAVTEAVEAVTKAAQMPRKKRRGISLNRSVTNRAEETRITRCW